MVEIGNVVVTTTSIYDDGEDHHPPGYLAMAGEELIVRAVREKSISVSHVDVTDKAFVLYEGEYKVKP